MATPSGSGNVYCMFYQLPKQYVKGLVTDSKALDMEIPDAFNEFIFPFFKFQHDTVCLPKDSGSKLFS